LRILCIEDEASTLDVYRRFISDAGHDVTLAKNGQEGIDLFLLNHESNPSEGTFDVVVVDFRMPVKDGVDAIKSILAAKPDQKIILATAYPYEVTHKAQDIPMDKVRMIRKPFDPDDLETYRKIRC
jgi:CheY-like chemotaxis protein